VKKLQRNAQSVIKTHIIRTQ